MISISDALRQGREALGLDLASVAEAALIDPPSLLRYEAGEQDVPGEVLWRLSDALGIPLDEIESPKELRHYVEVMAVRFKADKKSVSERLRFAVARASVAARHYVELEGLPESPSRYEKLVERFPKAPPLPAREIWKAGRELASLVREHFGVRESIPSLLSLVTKLGILVLWQKLPLHVAGYAFCDDIHGPTIIVNVNGRNANELVRRFTLAHEACHVLFDRDRLQGISNFDLYEDFYSFADNWRDPYEVRANAFAIHLLAPEKDFVDAWHEEKDIRRLMVRFGISFEAVRTYLDNYNLLPLKEKVSRVPTTAPDEYKSAESPELWYPAFDDIPLERRHAVAPLAFKLWDAGAITTSRLREVLGTRLSTEEISELSELYLGLAAA